MVISSGVVAVTAAIVHSVMTIQDGMVSSKIRAKQRKLEKKALEEDMENSFLAYRQLCQLREELELEAYQARRMQAEKTFLDNMIFASKMSNLQNFKLRIPPIALVNEVLMNVIHPNNNQSEKMVDSFMTSSVSYKPMKVFITPTNDEEINNGIWGNVKEQLETFFDERYSCNNTHQVSLFTDAWKNPKDLPSPVAIGNIHDVVDKEPIVFVTALCSDNQLSIKLYFWGIYDQEYKVRTIPENNTYTSFFTFTINPDGTNEELIQDIYSQIKASICFLCDIYTWNQYHIVPIYPNISKLENLIEPSLINEYISILGQSIASGTLSTVLDMKQLLNYAKTIDEAFDSKECSKYLFKSIDNKNSRKSKSIIDPCMGAASYFLKKIKDFLEEEFESASEQAENIMKQIEGSAKPLDQDNKQSDNRTNRSASESVKGPDFSIVSPRYNYTTWDFCKNNSSFYGFSNDYVHGLYISYVQSVIDYQSRRYFEAELKKHKIPWNQNLLFDYLADQLNVFIEQKITPIIFDDINNSLHRGRVLNTFEKQREQESYIFDIIKKLEDKIKNQLKEFFNNSFLNKTIVRVRYQYIITQILSNAISYIKESSNNDLITIVSDELSMIVPDSIEGEVDSEVAHAQRENRKAFISMLRKQLTEEENNKVTQIVTDMIAVYFKAQDINETEVSNFYPDDFNDIIHRLSVIIVGHTYSIKIEEWPWSPHVFYEDVEFTEQDRNFISKMIKKLANVLTYSTHLIDYFINSDQYTPDRDDEYKLSDKIISMASSRRENPFKPFAKRYHYK